MIKIGNEKIISAISDVLEKEAAAITDFIPKIDNNFVEVVKMIIDCSGHVVIVGVGKSGHIGKKIAATFASTGTPAFFVNGAEASHGDIGMVTDNDLVIAISNSGETEEILRLLPTIVEMNVKLIAITKNNTNSLAKMADLNLAVSVAMEACPLDLAPTSSTTLVLAIGDALAITVFECKGFSFNDFAKSHPGGALGKKLTLRVDDVMHTGSSVPKISGRKSMSEAILSITRGGLGFVAVVGENDTLAGVFTDGDLRRVLEDDIDLKSEVINNYMTSNCKKVSSKSMAHDALLLMRDYKINSLPVVNENNQVIGALNFHDLLKAGLS